MKRRDGRTQGPKSFSPDCKMLQALLLECEKSTQASGNRFDGRLGRGKGLPSPVSGSQAGSSVQSVCL